MTTSRMGWMKMVSALELFVFRHLLTCKDEEEDDEVEDEGLYYDQDHPRESTISLVYDLY